MSQTVAAVTTPSPDLQRPLDQPPPPQQPSQDPQQPSPADARDQDEHPDINPTHLLLSRLRLQSLRLRIAKARAEFEQTLLTVLTLNVIYMYYVDHSLLVLAIRAAQLIQLLYFPFTSLNSQRNTAVLLLVSNLPIIVIHNNLFTGSGALSNKVGEMLFINFIGPEPKSIAKIIAIDFVSIALQLIILQCRCDPLSFRLLSALPVPISEPLVPINVEPSNAPQQAPQSSHDVENAPATNAT